MAGASAKDIKNRIKSVENTMQITRAMQLVATSKMRRAKERMENSKTFARISRSALMEMAGNCLEYDPYLAPGKDAVRCYIMIAGDRGLAGGFNSNVFKAYSAHSAGRKTVVLPIGKRAVDKCVHDHAVLLTDRYVRAEGLSVGVCHRIANDLSARFLNGEFDSLYIIYTDFLSMMSQEVVIDRLLPIRQEDTFESTRTVVSVYEPELPELLKTAVPDFIGGRIYAAVCDSFASEISARRNAMDSATKNAGEMVKDLTLKFNRARQGAITQEITEIIAGAEQ